jgi:iron complex transport system ATP-binding protein
MPAAVTCRDVSVQADGRALIEGVSFDVDEGSWLCLLGPNGAGKSTLLRAMAGLRPYSGLISFGGLDAASVTARRRAKLVALVPQDPTFPPGLTVGAYVLLGRAAHQGWLLAPGRTDAEKVEGTLDALDLENLAARDLSTLSGGERQRVALARALVQDTPLLLLDEPTSALDIGHQLSLLELLAQLQFEGKTIITTLHDLSLAGQFADRLGVIAQGRLQDFGRPDAVLHPRTIERHWGVPVEVRHHGPGRISTTVHRPPSESPENVSDQLIGSEPDLYPAISGFIDPSG